MIVFPFFFFALSIHLASPEKHVSGSCGFPSQSNDVLFESFSIIIIAAALLGVVAAAATNPPTHDTIAAATVIDVSNVAVKSLLVIVCAQAKDGWS